MYEGMGIEQMAKELMAINEKKVDLIVPTNRLQMVNNVIEVVGDVPKSIEDVVLAPTSWAHNQIATFTGIPKKYYDHLNETGAHVLEHCVNHGFQMAVQNALAKRSESKRMIRTINGSIRGFLSSRYRRLDCHDLLNAVLPILLENEFTVKSCDLNDRRMYLKVVTDRIQGDVKAGMTVQYGLVISSSDVGCGSVRVEPLIYECICDNGMICETSMKKMHIGRDQGSGDIQELLSDETKELADELVWRSVVDLVNGSMQYVNFERELDKLREAAQVPIKNLGNLEQVVELTMKETGVSGDDKKQSILEHLANGADGRGFTKYGLANCFTFAAHKSETISYDDRTELERAGGKVITLPQNKWEKIAG